MSNRQSTTRFVDPYHDVESQQPLTTEERTVLHAVNQRIAAEPTLVDVIDYLFDETQALIPCDRISFAFIDTDGRVTSQFTRADYEPILLRKGYSETLDRGSLRQVLESGLPRIIDDLEQYLEEHPRSRSTRLLLKEGVRSSLTCPLQVEGRVVGFIFRSSRAPHVYTRRHVELQMSISERLSQAVEKAWRIEQLEEANRAYFQLLGFVAHELKSPLASVVTDARLLAHGYLGELSDIQADKVERIAQKAEYLIGLIREYLDLSQVESGELTLHARPDVLLAADVVLPTIDLLEVEARKVGMRFEVDLPGDEITVEADPGLLRIVLANFLSNAVKYGKPGGLVRVSAQVGERETSVDVWNEGPGFPAHQRHLLFRKFSRLRTQALSHHKGTGLGLYNAWRIIRLHHGRVAADSAEGSWAKFSFTIPQPLQPSLPTPPDLEAPS